MTVPEEQATTSPTRRHKALLCALLLVLAGLWAYRGTFRAPFIFDDTKIIGRRIAFYQLDKIPQLVAHTRRPLLHLSMALNYFWSGMDTWSYHLVNITIHLAAALALFGLVRRTLGLPHVRARYREQADMLALAVAGIWMLHPLQTQSVTYIVQRGESMMGLFFLVTLYCLVRGATAGAQRIAWCWFALGIVAFHLCLVSKEVGIAALFVVPFYDRIFLSRSWKELFQKRWAFHLGFYPILAWFGVMMLSTFESHPLTGAGFGVQWVTPWEYLRTQAEVLVHYLHLAVWPDALCLDYMWDVSQDPRRYLTAGLFILSLVAASFVTLWYRPRHGFLAVSFFAILAPTSSFVPIVDLAFEHRMYLPLAPLVGLFVLVFFDLTTRWIRDGAERRKMQQAVLIVIALALMVRTTMRNRQYQDPAVMWNDVVTKAPHNYAAWNNLAMHYASRGQDEDAIACYEKSLSLRPDFAKTHDNFGNVYARAKNYEQAERLYRAAIRVDRNYISAYVHLAIVLYEMGRTDEAINVLRHGLQRDPHSVALSHRLAWILATANENQFRNGGEAVQLAETAMEQSGQHDFRALDVLAAAYAEAGRFPDAIQSAQRALDAALAVGAASQAEQMRLRLELYRKGLPFRHVVRPHDAQNARQTPPEAGATG